MEEIIELLMQIGKLKRTVRSGWVKQGVKDPESVADHSFRTAVMVLFLAKKLGYDDFKCVKMALIHDLAESVIGDIITEVGNKEVANVKEKSEKEKTAMKQLLSQVEDGDELFKLWLEFESQGSAEGRFVKALDKLEMVMQALEYESDNPTLDFDDFWVNAEKYITEDTRKIFDSLEDRRHIA